MISSRLKFKLYLYGIEIWIWWAMNLTIMFKLYLYGIEIHKAFLRALRNGVQIVPLWNWNFGLNYQNCRNQMVQIVPLWNWNGVVMAFPLDEKPVQIVPLWNWNEWKMRKKRKQYCSNCTFMELKYDNMDDIDSAVKFKLYLYGIEI